MPKSRESDLMESTRFPEMVEEFNLRVVNGPLSINKFYTTVFSKTMPDFSKSFFFKYFSRFSNEGKSNIILKYDNDGKVLSVEPPPSPQALVVSLAQELAPANQDQDRATSRGIEAALKLGAKALEDLLEHPEELAAIPYKDRVEILFKAMRAQDARVNVAINVRKEGRANRVFQSAFDEAAYQVDAIAEEDAQPQPAGI
jgi:hypothetical protein